MEKLYIKKENLKKNLRLFDCLVVAFSGGVDSTFLLAVAHEVLKEKVIAVTSHSSLHFNEERTDAVRLAKKIGVKHIIINSNELSLEEFCLNTHERCYICKKNLFQEMEKVINIAKVKTAVIVHGANMDDLDDYRPGFRAAEEFNITAPLITAGLTKAEIRKLSQKMGLETWNKPSMSCLATRIPYYTNISEKLLVKVAGAERVLKDAGFEDCRVRYHGDVARIEISASSFQKIMQVNIRTDIIKKIKEIGFIYVVLDLDGYVQGSMNRMRI